MDISEKLAAANARLKAELVGVKIAQAANRLHFRGTFPPKPTSTRTKPYQQRIYPGFRANPAGLRAAEKEARLVGALIQAKEFDWRRYIEVTKKSQGSCGVWMERLEHWVSVPRIGIW